MNAPSSDGRCYRTVHVNVRLTCGETEWRQVRARDLQEAIRIAERSHFVARALEASYIPGGVVT